VTAPTMTRLRPFAVSRSNDEKRELRLFASSHVRFVDRRNVDVLLGCRTITRYAQINGRRIFRIFLSSNPAAAEHVAGSRVHFCLSLRYGGMKTRSFVYFVHVKERTTREITKTAFTRPATANYPRPFSSKIKIAGI